MNALFTSFEPNMGRQDLGMALRLLCLPSYWRTWVRGDDVGRVEGWLRQYVGVPYAWTVDSGRSALFLALEAVGVGKGDEVALQAYTCVVVVNAITALGATPVYVDCEEDGNIDPLDLERKITKNTKAVIVQHTFGQPADMDTITAVTKKFGIRLVEDCAHALGARYRGIPVGAGGDVAMFSFGSDKIISAARGGAVVTSDKAVAEKIAARIEKLPPMPRRIILRHLLRYPVFFLGKKGYKYYIGKWFLAFAKASGLVNKIITREEKQGIFPSGYPRRFPNGLARLLLVQLDRLERMNDHRRRIVAVYEKHLPANVFRRLPARAGAAAVFLRYTLLVPDPGKLRSLAKKRGILLGEWYDTVIAPHDIAMAPTQYVTGSCPVAEDMARRSVNLPTHQGITERDALHIVDLLLHSVQTSS